MLDEAYAGGAVAVSPSIGHPTRTSAPVLRGLTSCIRTLGLWIERWSTRADLAELEPFELADIGLTEHARRCECEKRFWQ